eukprot:Hpha_TRINITY_DN16829_c2_g1::TRINITY_DN16829_c2_g1_i4::g.152706::m.152706
MCRGGVCKGVHPGGNTKSIAGTLSVKPGTSVRYTASDWGDGGEIDIPVVVKDDALKGIPPGTTFGCGLGSTAEPGMESSLIRISGTTRRGVVEGCSARVVSSDTVIVTFKPSSEMVPGEREVLSISLAPGLLASGEESRSSVKLEVQPPQVGDGVSGVGIAALISPKSTNLLVKLRGCSQDNNLGDEEDEPPEEVDIFTNPGGIKIGPGRYALLNGAVLFHIVAITLLGLSVCLAYGIITLVVGSDIPSVRRWEASRVGWLMYPYMILYPGAVLMAATVLKYSDHVPSRVLAAVLLLWCLTMPYLTVKVLCRVQAFADYSPTHPESLKERVVDGSNTWDWNGGGKGWAEFRIFHMFFDSYRMRDKSFLVCDLFYTLVIALIQSYRPESEAGCDTQAYLVFIIMVLFAVYYTLRVVSISPTEQGMDVLILWTEITVKSLVTFVDPGADVMHWSLRAAGILTVIAFAVVMTKTVFSTIILSRDEKDHWMLFKAGGGQTRPGLDRAFNFFLYWVFYNRVPKMLREKGPPPPAYTPILEELYPALPIPEGPSSPALRSPPREYGRMSFSTGGPAHTPMLEGPSMITDIIVTTDPAAQSSRS